MDRQKHLIFSLLLTLVVGCRIFGKKSESDEQDTAPPQKDSTGSNQSDEEKDPEKIELLLNLTNMCEETKNAEIKLVFDRLKKDKEDCKQTSSRIFSMKLIDLSTADQKSLNFAESTQKISTVEPLKFLINAKTMLLQGNNISDFSPLNSLPNLLQLNISSNPTKAIPAIEALEVLDISGTKIKNIEGVQKNKALKELYIESLGISQEEINKFPDINVFRKHCLKLGSHYNDKGYSSDGYHRETGTEFGPDHLTQSGSRFGSDHKTYDGKNYFNGYDYQGFNKKGFDRSNIHKKTKTEFGPDHLTQSGSRFGSDHKTYDGKKYYQGYDHEGFDPKGFDRSKIHKETRTEFGPDHLTHSGSRFGADNRTYDHQQYFNGYDYQGYDTQGYNSSNIHRETRTEFGPDGFNRQGKNSSGHFRSALQIFQVDAAIASAERIAFRAQAFAGPFFPPVANRFSVGAEWARVGGGNPSAPIFHIYHMLSSNSYFFAKLPVSFIPNIPDSVRDAALRLDINRVDLYFVPQSYPGAESEYKPSYWLHPDAPEPIPAGVYASGSVKVGIFESSIGTAIEFPGENSHIRVGSLVTKSYSMHDDRVSPDHGKVNIGGPPVRFWTISYHSPDKKLAITLHWILDFADSQRIRNEIIAGHNTLDALLARIEHIAPYNNPDIFPSLRDFLRP